MRSHVAALGPFWVAGLLLQPSFAAASSTTALEASVRAAEYRISVHDGVHQAPNREHGFRTRFLETGIVVVPRTEVEMPWSWGLSWTGYGRGEEVGPVPKATLSAKGNRIDYLRGGHVEWYENSEKGLKQSFRLAAPPEGGAGDVCVELALTGDLDPTISEDGLSIDFVRGSERVLRYSQLIVTDARGRYVPARMEGFVRGIRIVLDDSDAVYPITIDPLASAPAWTFEANQVEAETGRAVSTAGDVNGDGYSDVLVGARLYDNGQTDEGRVFLFLGSPSGLSTTPAWTAEGDQADAYFGLSSSTAGDVNGDGYADVIIGAYAYDNGETNEGRAYVYHGSASGLSTTPAWITEGNQANAEYGSAVSTAGDVNGDGYSDVIVGTYAFDNGQTDEGRAWVYLGSASGLSTTPAWTAESDQASAQFGNSVSTAGDVNADGYADVIVGAPAFDNGQTNEGRAFLYLGSASGPSPTPSWTGESDQAFASYGWSVSTAGDVNGDGYADVVVGAPDYDNGQSGEGRGYVYLGSATGLSPTAAWTRESDQTLARYGIAVATAGDVEGDGYADVLIGADFYNGGQGSEGRAFVYRGSASGLPATASWTAEPDYVAAYFGASLGTAGDVNGDGLSDVVVGAPGYDNGQNEEGRVFVYLGTPAKVPESVPGWTKLGEQANDGFGNALDGAGDVNGDGYADVIVGAPLFDTGLVDAGRTFLYLGSASGPSTTPAWTASGDQAFAQFGSVVAGAGDVNGDGYDDVIVAAPLFDGTFTDVGRVQLFQGSPTGLATTPVWSAEGMHVSEQLGNPASDAGDVDGDGYGDIVVGSPGYGVALVAEGRAILYRGSPTGPSTSPAWTATGGQAFARFGSSVDGAGDIDGDGFGDLIVGARTFDNGQTDEGLAFVYRGSPAGLSTSPSRTLEANVAGEGYGGSVSGAGDVNGDGYAEVLVGASSFADLYIGSPGGLSTDPYWTASFVGHRVTDAGDVNGDGFADLVVSDAPDLQFPATAYLYLGSASGPSTLWDWSVEGVVLYGVSHAAAGDVNGDGLADLLVGPLQAELYYGGGQRGAGVLARQRTADDTRPIARLGASDVAGSFRISALGRTAFGRGRVRLESEVKALGLSFDGAGTQRSDLVNTGATAATVVQGLGVARRYHWRLRMIHDAVTAPFAVPRGRWTTVPWGGWNETMMRTSSTPSGRASNLRVEKAGLGVTVTYQKSCLPTDTLHAVFEGTLGDFTSHVPVTCESVGSSWNFTPQAGNRYFLVVPLNAEFEGSHGTNHAGAERPRGSAVCRPQNIGACP